MDLPVRKKPSALQKEALIEKYDLGPVLADVREIIDLPSAIWTVVTRGGWIPPLVMVISWFTANDAPTWLRFMFAMGGGFMAVATGFFLGMLLLTQQRLESGRRAISHSLEAVERIHADINALRDGERNREQVIEMADNLMTGVVLPAVDEVALVVPLPKFVVGPLADVVTWAPKRIVHRGVMKSVEALPWEEMGARIEERATTVALRSESVQGFRENYAHLRTRVEEHARKATTVTTVTLAVLLTASVIPILFWLAIGRLL